ncbi:MULTISPECIES: sugar ABC transporter permease [Streptomyces]|uniref:Xylose transport system permease protein XylH n=1 Tax=Streptomyces sudanensis TaxID=436397 RepID=A0ABY4TH01_9ACTN|nr:MULTISPECIES: ABC transporter permease [Streptomyces]MCP9988860.1 sugar ABC transporter permease [Streptomyces sudanensis]URN18156.1 sugar ABC transporter permease [Streptomyces sudanensis]
MNALRRALGSGVEAAGRRLGTGEPGVLPVVVGVLVIWSVFQGLNGNFLAPRNLSNLGVDIVGPGMIAVGVVFVLLIGEIDLSVGSVSGLAAALFAVLSVRHGVAEWLAVAAAVLCGAAIGALHGLLVARVGVPAFAVTLAGLLGWNGLMLYVLGAAGTVNLDEESLLGRLTGHYFHEVAAAYGLAAAGSVLYFLVSHRDRRRRRAAGMPHRPLTRIAVRTGAVALVAFLAAHVLNRFQGLPLALLAFLLVVGGLDLVLRRTRYGRKVYALGGGGGEPARRAGIDVVRVRVSVFALSGTMAAVGGLFLASRITSVSQTSGSSLLLMNVIAAAVIGGTSLFGGRGTTWSALLGMLVIQSIASGMSLLGIEAAVQFTVTGGVLLAAVVVDTVARRIRREHGRA